MKAIAAVVRGRVQGVGFRYSTRALAERLGVAGWVRNEPDGAVAVWAQGDDDAVAQLAAFLESGPPGAVVVEVAIEDVATDPALTAFGVVFG